MYECQAYNPSMYHYRAFISYSHKDEELIKIIDSTLRDVGLRPTFDVSIPLGDAFLDNIKALITQAHVFIAVLTANSHNSAWLHQEAGFALALRVPVLTLLIGVDLPAGMMGHIQAIRLSANPEDLKQQIREIPFHRILNSKPTRNVAPVEVVDWPERRSEVIAGHANWLWSFAEACRVRHRGPLTSFSIPDAPLDDLVWEQCGEGPRGSEYLRHVLREERRALERHARVAGCSLVINPDMVLDERYTGSLEVRRNTLIKFLESMPDEKVTAAFVNSAVDGSIILVGDWYSATSHAPRKGGYRQTVITWHAPSVLAEVQAFEDQIDAALSTAQIDHGASRRYVLDRLRQRSV